MNASNLKLTGFLLCFTVFPAHAINKSTVVNNTDKKIAVAWTALGCAGDIFHHHEVCGAVILEPGQGHKYQYNWGDTNDHVHGGGYFKKLDEYLVEGALVGFDPELPDIITIIKGNCKFPSHDGKVVYIKSMDINEEHFTIDCAYEVKSPPSGDIDSFKVPGEGKCSDRKG